MNVKEFEDYVSIGFWAVWWLLVWWSILRPRQ